MKPKSNIFLFRVIDIKLPQLVITHKNNVSQGIVSSHFTSLNFDMSSNMDWLGILWLFCLSAGPILASVDIGKSQSYNSFTYVHREKGIKTHTVTHHNLHPESNLRVLYKLWHKTVEIKKTI